MAKKTSSKKKARQVYDDLPWYLKAIQAADDVARFGANAATLGYADDIAGYLNGNGGDAERLLTADAIDRAGAAALAAETVGTMAPMGGLVNSPMSATRIIPASWTGGQGIGAQLAALGADGLTLGAVQSPQIDRLRLLGNGQPHGPLLGSWGR